MNPYYYISVTLANAMDGNCTIQLWDPRNPYDIEELLDLIRRASLTTIRLFSPLIVKLLRRARADPEVLELLRCLRAITGGGAVFTRAEEEWVVSVGINVRPSQTLKCLPSCMNVLPLMPTSGRRRSDALLQPKVLDTIQLARVTL